MSQSRSEARSEDWIWWLLALGVLAAALGRILHLGRGTTFFFDEWNFLLDRNEISISNLLESHNGHLSAIPVAVYQFLLRLFGGGTYFPYRLLSALLHCLIALTAGLMVRRRAGFILSVATIVLIGFMGAGWQNWLWGFQIGMQLSVLSGLLGLLLLGEGCSSTRQYVAGGVLAISMLSSGVGIAVLVGLSSVAVVRRLNRFLVVAFISVVVYGGWSLRYGESQAQSRNIGRLTSYVAESASTALADLGGWNWAIGGVIAGVVIGPVIATIRQRTTSSVYVLGLGAICLSGWVMSALSRAHLGEPGASRYVHVALCWMIPMSTLALSQRKTSHLIRNVAVVLVVVLAVPGSWDVADRAGVDFRERSQIVRAELTAMMQISGSVEAGFQPDPSRAPQISAARFKKFAARYSAPLIDPAEFESLPNVARQEIDRVLSIGVGLEDHQVPVDHGQNCDSVEANHQEILKPEQKYSFSGVHSVEIRRFGDTPISLSPTLPGTPSQLMIEVDQQPRPWTARFISATPFVLCVD